MSLRIIIAEDDDHVRSSLMSMLTLEGHHVSAVDNSLDLFRLAASSNPFELIIADICMPMGQGDEVISTLRSKKIMTPAILISALTDIPAPPRGVKFLPKPFSHKELLALIDETVVKPA